LQFLEVTNLKDLLKKVLELDIAYLDTFTNRINRDWGYLFYNEAQPSYYDANHAQIVDVPAKPKAIIEEVIQFYKNKNLSPRFYIYDPENQTNLLQELPIYGFKYEELISPVQIWTKEIHEHQSNDKVTIEVVSEANFQEALEIECNITEFGGREVREKAFPEEFKHPAYTHYLLRYDGVACSRACIFEHNGLARMESVATLEAYRGKGLIGELILHIQKEVQKRGIQHLWVFPINERVEKVYARYGFNTVGKFKTGHAYSSGKSIKELQGK
jgi:N-acetylglutamate synthase-like GNAT family acetyltransferase